MACWHSSQDALFDDLKDAVQFPALLLLRDNLGQINDAPVKL